MHSSSEVELQKILNTKININDIFESISGEHGGVLVESFVQFIRFQGCDVGCLGCDSTNTWNCKKDQFMSISDIIKDIKCKNIVITGGEPLMQEKALGNLIICLAKYLKVNSISIETSGAYPIPTYKKWEEVYNSLDKTLLTWVVDYKSKVFGEKAHSRMSSVSDFFSRFEKWGDSDLFNYITDFFSRPRIMYKVVAGNEEDMKLVKEMVEFWDKVYYDNSIHTSSYSKFPYKNFIPVFALSPLDGDPDLVTKIIDYCLEDELLATYLREGLLTVSLQIHKIVKML